MNIDVLGKKINMDEEGYLINLDDWSDEFAEKMAFLQSQQDHMELTETHWGLIHYFRDYYDEHKTHPTMHQLAMTLGKHHGQHFLDHKVYERFLYKIFPHGPVQELCKLAGLPKPLLDIEG